MPDVQRPTRVVVVDADNPMNEVRGEFFWREDHDQLLAAARESAYRQGYHEGLAAAAASLRPMRWRVRVRRRWSIARMLFFFALAAFLVSLIGSFLR